MLFNSVAYLIFFPVAALLYFLFPKKIRMYWLLACSYYFYMSWNAKYGLLILAATLITYFSAILIKKSDGKESRKKLILAIGLILDFGMLFYFKYANFAIDTLNFVMDKIGLAFSCQSFNILLPVGISFFVFQSAGYVIDVYRNDIEPETNFFRYALFISFFPQLVAGPIERSKNLLNQLKQPTGFSVENARNGLLIIAYGLFMKIAVADNISAITSTVFAEPANYSGMMNFLAFILFSVQIFCDFNGYTQIAIGSAKVLGYNLCQNFDAPFLSTSVRENWRRWHMSLSSWFTDYLYIPLGGNRKGKFRKALNTIIVFACVGLWHGANWTCVVGFAIAGVCIVVEDLTNPVKEKIDKKLSINVDTCSYVTFRRIRTFLIFSVTAMFLNSKSLSGGITMLKQIMGGFRLGWIFDMAVVDELSNLSLITNGSGDYPNALTFFAKIVVSAAVVFTIDIAQHKGKDIKALIFSQQRMFRWIIYVGIILAIIYLGYYGYIYDTTQFIYFQF